MISSSSPGKLYIAGEYAVVQKDHSAILIAVDQFITVNLKETNHRGSIQAFDNSPIPFIRKGDRLVLDYRDNNLSYVINSINVVESLVDEKDLKFYDLSIDSELMNDEGLKYGLGSSAAVTVSTIKVLCKLYNLKMNKIQLFKLAAIVHQNMQSNGSCGDVASSVFGGWIHYKTFDKEWLEEKLKTESVESLINQDWPYLAINYLNVPSDLNLLIGWTNSPASTTLLVDQLNKYKGDHKAYYNNFLASSEASVMKMIEAFNNNDTQAIMVELAYLRTLLQGLDLELGMNIETPTLKALADIAVKYEYSAKSSGAGGGDCGIVISNTNANNQNIIDEWHANDILHLPLNIYEGDSDYA